MPVTDKELLGMSLDIWNFCVSYFLMWVIHDCIQNQFNYTLHCKILSVSHPHLHTKPIQLYTTTKPKLRQCEHFITITSLPCTQTLVTYLLPCAPSCHQQSPLVELHLLWCEGAMGPAKKAGGLLGQLLHLVHQHLLHAPTAHQTRACWLGGHTAGHQGGACWHLAVVTCNDETHCPDNSSVIFTTTEQTICQHELWQSTLHIRIIYYTMTEEPVRKQYDCADN